MNDGEIFTCSDELWPPRIVRYAGVDGVGIEVIQEQCGMNVGILIYKKDAINMAKAILKELEGE
jgi:hypothetical protein